MTEETKQEPVRLIAPLPPDCAALAESSIARVRVYAPAGVKPDDMVTVAFWSNVASMFVRIRERGECFIDALAEDGSWYAEFLVRDAGRNWAKVSLLRKVQLEQVQISRSVALLPGHTVSHGGPVGKWRVVRDSDARVLKDKFATEGDAYAWLSEYAKGLAA